MEEKMPELHDRATWTKFLKKEICLSVWWVGTALMIFHSIARPAMWPPDLGRWAIIGMLSAAFSALRVLTLQFQYSASHYRPPGALPVFVVGAVILLNTFFGFIGMDFSYTHRINHLFFAMYGAVGFVITALLYTLDHIRSKPLLEKR
jgi:hypothetical protein